MESNVPNLHAMEKKDLMSFWDKHNGGRGARDLFPAGGKGTRTAAANLASYAKNIAIAKSCRSVGDVQSALIHEGIADRIYDALPDWAKGW